MNKVAAVLDQIEAEQQMEGVIPDDIPLMELADKVVRGKIKLTPSQQRMLIEMLPYIAPKLSATAIATMDGQTFAEALERCILRSKSPPQLNSPVVDAQVIEEPTKPYRRINGRSSPYRRF